MRRVDLVYVLQTTADTFEWAVVTSLKNLVGIMIMET